MSKKDKKTNAKTKTIDEIVKSSSTLEEAQEAASEIYSSQPIYNIFNFFIGGPNKAKINNDQKGKPGTPPY